MKTGRGRPPPPRVNLGGLPRRTFKGETGRSNTRGSQCFALHTRGLPLRGLEGEGKEDSPVMSLV